jgi:hypothetical protein
MGIKILQTSFNDSFESLSVRHAFFTVGGEVTVESSTKEEFPERPSRTTVSLRLKKALHVVNDEELAS